MIALIGVLRSTMVHTLRCRGVCTAPLQRSAGQRRFDHGSRGMAIHLPCCASNLPPYWMAHFPYKARGATLAKPENLTPEAGRRGAAATSALALYLGNDPAGRKESNTRTQTIHHRARITATHQQAIPRRIQSVTDAPLVLICCVR